MGRRSRWARMRRRRGSADEKEEGRQGPGEGGSRDAATAVRVVLRALRGRRRGCARERHSSRASSRLREAAPIVQARSAENARLRAAFVALN